MVYVHPYCNYLGKIPILTHIFSDGLVNNHQPVKQPCAGLRKDRFVYSMGRWEGDETPDPLQNKVTPPEINMEPKNECLEHDFTSLGRLP